MNQDTCIGPECEREQMARSEYCVEHRRQERLGKPLKPIRPRALTTQQRFWVQVSKNGPVPQMHPELGNCWVWTSYTDEKGYGRFGLDGRTRIPHRLSYEWENGPIPEGMVIDHICHTPACVRPNHLRCATNKHNVEYRRGRNRNNTSGYRGVTWSRQVNKWRAVVSSGGKSYYAGSFDDPHEAHLAVVAKRRELHLWDAPDNYAA